MLLFLATALVLVTGRLIKCRFDFSYFIVAGSDFVDPAKTPAPVIVQNGQGYDGQFFYRYALNPFDFKQNDYGIKVDHPPYRIQRIAYPFFAWLLSIGGIPAAVPILLVLLNVLAFTGISFYTDKLIALLNGNTIMGLFPLFLCGIYMAVARDLSEVSELFFFTGAVYYLFRPRYLWFSIFAALAILSHETAIIAIVPLAACCLFRVIRKEAGIPILLYACMPFLLFIGWKAFIYTHTSSPADTTIRYESIGLPFKGIMDGFKENLNFSTRLNTLQFLFWIAYLCWQISFVIILFSKVSFRQLTNLDNLGILKIIYLVWLVFALCFSTNIYGDDWGFVRIFSLWNMVGIMILIASRKQTGWLFNSCSVLLVLLTIARLIIRV